MPALGPYAFVSRTLASAAEDTDFMEALDQCSPEEALAQGLAFEPESEVESLGF